jgi:hypothetical protein
MDRHPPTYEPIIIRDAEFYVERVLSGSGEIQVNEGDRVEPETELATTTVAAARPVSLHVARELGVDPGAISQYLSKPIGSTFQEGEPLARARRGLRSVSCNAPVTATLTAVDEGTGVVTLVPKADPLQLFATVYGDVAAVQNDQQVTIRTSGTRIQGSLGLGSDVFGPLRVGVDRGDRELTPDMVYPDFRDSIVLGGMTLGTAALRRLADVGAKGVIIGSIGEQEIRRFLGDSENELHSVLLWRKHTDDFDMATAGRQSITVFVTEGYGRRRMAQPLFQTLSGYDNQIAAIHIPRGMDVLEARPMMYITSDRKATADPVGAVPIRRGTVARLIDPQHLGVVVTCKTGVLPDAAQTGILRDVVRVELSNGSQRIVPAVNLEVLDP